jgi:hypothetical protein
MPEEFGTGLRAHIQRTATPLGLDAVEDENEPAGDEQRATAAIAAEYSGRLTELDARERMLAEAGAELAFRERRLLEREAALVTAAQRMAAEMVSKLLQPEPELEVDDELARVRARVHARRQGSVA